jgi:hypothetical protein
VSYVAFLQLVIDESSYFVGTDWTGVSLEEFMSCPHNLANNRQTRMLANLTLVGCYDRSVMPNSDERDRVLLHSAMDNLRQMAFFGLTEHQSEMRYLFERTFGIHFRRDFSQFTDTHASKIELTASQLEVLQSLNRLDIELYRFASELFAARVRRARELDSYHSSAAGITNEHFNVIAPNDVHSYKADDDTDDDIESNHVRTAAD